MVYTPVAPTAPFVPVPAPRQRRRRSWLVVLVAVVALLADVVAAVVFGPAETTTPVPTGAYTPAFDRTVEHAGGTTPLTTDQIDKIASNAGVYVFSKFSQNWNLASQFDVTRQLVDAGHRYGNDIKVYEYFNSSFWYDKNEQGWGSYSQSFKKSWLLDDTSGDPIEFHGIGKSKIAGDDPVGYMVDLSNPSYRQWAVNTLVAWAKAAPLAGLNLDSANPLSGDDARTPIGDGKSTWNEMLCGSSATTDCSRVQQWNNGLTSFIQEASDALHPLGVQVAYNGVLNSTNSGTRNIELLQHADTANNESFCLKNQPLQPDQVTYAPVKPDIDMMITQNALGKKLVENTSYQSPSKESTGPFCLGAFLMGWEPSMDYFGFHESYYDPLDGAYPKFPEINLNLGAPKSVYQDDNGVMSRSFDRGYVLVNDSTTSATAKLPAAAVQFSGGKQVATVGTGDEVTLGPQQAKFFLWSGCVSTAKTCG